MTDTFQVEADYALTGDQPQAVESLATGVARGDRYQTLLGVTGSGKTFTMANVIARARKPTLVIAHNKTLAAQLCNEFREFLPGSAVEYFVSYYDYYQPEAYVPQADLYIEKDSSINDEIDRLRHAATNALLMRRDTVIVASVSCIFGLGSPDDYLQSVVLLRTGDHVDRDAVLRKLVDIQYQRNDYEPTRGKFRVRGDSFEVWPADQDTLLRVELWGDEIEAITRYDPVSGEVVDKPQYVAVYPATHFVTSGPAVERALAEIQRELDERCAWFDEHDKVLEAHRLRQRTHYDMEMLREMGFCNGIENYSRILLGKQPGATPNCLLDFFPDDYLVFIDESHMTVPQIHGMYEGDRSRKQTLVDYGFRLPSALDNRPLRFDEFIAKVPQIVFVSATPGQFELRESVNIAEQIIRPTGLIDPAVEVRPTRRPDRRPHERGAPPHRARRARAGSPRSPSACPKTSPTSSSRTAFGCATCTARSTRCSASRSCASCASASSTSWSASTCCARGSTCPRSRWSPSSTPTKRASCAARRASSRRSAARRATSTARSSCTPTARRPPCASPSTRPIAAAAARWPTMKSTASRRAASSRRSPTSPR